MITLGLLHRGSEVLITLRQRGQSLGYLDRLDYVAMLSYESSWSECLESILSLVSAYSRAAAWRLGRLIAWALNHGLGLGCHAGDLGRLNCLLWLFEDRELLYGVVALIFGCRVHAVGSVVQGFFGFPWFAAVFLLVALAVRYYAHVRRNISSSTTVELA